MIAERKSVIKSMSYKKFEVFSIFSNHALFSPQFAIITVCIK